MRSISGIGTFGLAGLVLGLGAVAAGFLISGEFGALLRGYGAMLLPAAACLLGGLGLRHVFKARAADQTSAVAAMSARDGSFRA